MTGEALRTLGARLIVVSLCIAAGAAVVRADDGCGEWIPALDRRTPAPWGAAWGDGLFVRVGSGGEIGLSEDGRRWRRACAPPEVDLYDVAFGDGHWVAVGRRLQLGGVAEGVILASDTGERWRDVRHGGPILRAVGWRSGQWLAAGDGGVVMSSPEGLAWQVAAHVGNQRTQVLDIQWAGSRWLAVGSDRSAASGCDVALAVSSDDGIVWQTWPVYVPGSGFGRLAWNGTTAVAVGTGSMCPSGPPVPLIVRIFADGGWTSDFLSSLGTRVGCSVDDVAWSGEEFLAVGGCPGLGAKVPPTDFGLASTDGLTWTPADPKKAPLVAAPGLVTSAADPGRLVSTATRSLVRVGERVVSLEVDTNFSYPGEVTAVRVGATDDGVAWTWPWELTEGLGSGWTGDLASDGARAVAVGQGLASWSDDGRTWQPFDSGVEAGDMLETAAATPTGFVALGRSGGGPLRLTSPDGRRWTRGDWSGPAGLTDMVWHRDRLVSVSGTEVATSTDGAVWAKAAFLHARRLSAIASDGSRLVAVGTGGEVFVSSDGLDWGLKSSGVASELLGVAWTGREWIATGNDGVVLASIDGDEWQRFEVPTSTSLQTAVRLGDNLLVAGDDLVLLRRDHQPALVTPGRHRVVVPAAASRPGVGDTRWRSRLVLTDPGGRATLADLWLLGEDGPSPAAATLVVAAGESVAVPDVVGGLLGHPSGRGAVLVASDEPLVVTSRTFTGGADGTRGQAIPGLAIGEEAAPVDGGVLLGLADDSAARTNVGVANPTASTARVVLRFTGGDDTPLGARTIDLAPFSWRQLDGLLREVAGAPVALASATVEVVAGDPGLAVYASVVDNASGDAVLVLPSRLSAEPLILPAAAHVGGAEGTFWRTDLDLEAPFGRATVVLEWLGSGTTSSASLDLPAGRPVRIADVVRSLLGRDETGALRLVPSGAAVVAASRTFTVGPRGSVGQWIPAILDSDALASGQTAIVTGLEHWPERVAGFRTNLGVVTLDPGPATCRVTPGPSGLVEPEDAGLEQVNDLLRSFGGNLPEAAGRASVTCTGSRFLAWASVVDNLSGDPVFLLAGPLPPPTD